MKNYFGGFMKAKKCKGGCALENQVVLAKKPGEKEYIGGIYSLIGCRSCGRLEEYRRGQDADRWGTARSETVEIDYEYAEENYGLTKVQIQEEFEKN